MEKDLVFRIFLLIFRYNLKIKVMDKKNIYEIIAEEQAYKIHNTIQELSPLEYKSGREKRREKRALKRKSKK
jgi:hypothetical protein